MSADSVGMPSSVHAPSSRSNAALVARPSPNPVSVPSAPITRWQGSTIGNGLRPLAAYHAHHAHHAYRAYDTRRINATCEARIARGLAVRNGGESRPDLSSQWSAAEPKRQIERLASAGKILEQLRASSFEPLCIANPVEVVGECMSIG